MIALELLDILARWLHVLGVLVWVGHNYANVVQRPTYRRLLPDDPPEAIRDVFLAASRREHGVFRHASLLVLVSGLYMLWHRGLIVDALTLSGAGRTIGVGVWCGLLMVANLWFVLWPHQKKVLGFVPAPTAERLRCTRITFLSSRLNSILSLPTVFFMAAGSHAPFLFS